MPSWVVDEAARDQLAGEQPNYGPFLDPPSDGPRGWTAPAGRYHLPGTLRPADPPRRSLAERLTIVLVALTVGLGAVFLTARLLDQVRVPPELLGSYAERTDLPQPIRVSPAVERPTAGWGELPTRLGPVVTPEKPSDSWVYSFEDRDGTPVLWSPCRAIHYVVNTDDAPPDFVLRVTEEVERVSEATGLVFRYDGTTTEKLSEDREAFVPELYGDRWAPLLIGWADADVYPYLDDEIAGLAHYEVARDRSTRRLHLVSGQVILHIGKAPTTANRYLRVLRHELGHIVGLGHIEDEDQLMHPGGPRRDFGDGDLAGLAAVGQGPCAPTL